MVTVVAVGPTPRSRSVHAFPKRGLRHLQGQAKSKLWHCDWTRMTNISLYILIRTARNFIAADSPESLCSRCVPVEDK